MSGKGNKIRVGDRIKFRKFYWEITEKKRTTYGTFVYKYKVVRLYFKRLLPLSSTKCTYEIGARRWHFLRKMLEQDPNYHYNMSLWSNAPR